MGDQNEHTRELAALVDYLLVRISENAENTQSFERSIKNFINRSQELSASGFAPLYAKYLEMSREKRPKLIGALRICLRKFYGGIKVSVKSILDFCLDELVGDHREMMVADIIDDLLRKVYGAADDPVVENLLDDIRKSASRGDRQTCLRALDVVLDMKQPAAPEADPAPSADTASSRAGSVERMTSRGSSEGPIALSQSSGESEPKVIPLDIQDEEELPADGGQGACELVVECGSLSPDTPPRDGGVIVLSAPASPCREDEPVTISPQTTRPAAIISPQTSPTTAAISPQTTLTTATISPQTTPTTVTISPQTTRKTNTSSPASACSLAEEITTEASQTDDVRPPADRESSPAGREESPQLSPSDTAPEELVVMTTEGTELRITAQNLQYLKDIGINIANTQLEFYFGIEEPDHLRSNTQERSSEPVKSIPLESSQVLEDPRSRDLDDGSSSLVSEDQASPNQLDEDFPADGMLFHGYELLHRPHVIPRGDLTESVRTPFLWEESHYLRKIPVPMGRPEAELRVTREPWGTVKRDPVIADPRGEPKHKAPLLRPLFF